MQPSAGGVKRWCDSVRGHTPSTAVTVATMAGFARRGSEVIANQAVYPGATGLSILLKPGGEAGRVSVVDSIVQVAGLDLDATGSAVVAKGLTEELSR